MTYVDNTEKSPVALSFCPGVLGLERGIERAVGRKFRVAAYVEREAFIDANLLAGMEAGLLDAAPIWTNLKTFDPRPFRDRVDLITGGYPCQPFSNAGQRKGILDPRHLYPYIERAVPVIRPSACFFENVRGHVTCGLPEVIASLEGLGYRVHWGIFSAEETGAPHKRERVFIMAVANGAGLGWLDVSRVQSEVVGGSYLAYTGYHRHRPQLECKSEEQQTERSEEFSPGSELADDHGFTRRTGQHEQKGRDESTGQAVGQADSFSEGLEIRRKQSAWKKQQAVERSYYTNRWPARPGEVQYEWERPRTISYAEEQSEPPLGCAINGYRFREDLLRALGNSVVEHTAEIAFRTLLEKFK